MAADCVADLPRIDFRNNDPDESPNVHCKMVSVSEFERMNVSDYQFSIIHLNIRSIRKNFSLLESFLSFNDDYFDVVALTETWLCSDYDVVFQLRGYNKFSIYRNSHGGGISVYIKKAHDANIIADLTFVGDNFEILTLNVRNNDTNIKIACIYRPPSNSIVDYINFLSNSLLPKLRNANCIICGDLNI